MTAARTKALLAAFNQNGTEGVIRVRVVGEPENPTLVIEGDEDVLNKFKLNFPIQAFSHQEIEYPALWETGSLGRAMHLVLRPFMNEEKKILAKLKDVYEELKKLGASDWEINSNVEVELKQLPEALAIDSFIQHYNEIRHAKKGPRKSTPFWDKVKRGDLNEADIKKHVSEKPKSVAAKAYQQTRFGK